MAQQKRRRNFRTVVICGNREVPKEQTTAVLLDMSRSFREKQELNRATRRLARIETVSHERRSVQRAMFSVEQRIVEALWTLARLPNDRGIGFAQRNGIGYIAEYADRVEQGRAAGWMATPPRPSPPSARAIDAMHEPLEWLRMLERSQAKLLSEGAMSRRGDMANPVRWSRIRRALELEHLTVRTLQRRYEAAVRAIVAELTTVRVAKIILA